MHKLCIHLVINILMPRHHINIAIDGINKIFREYRAAHIITRLHFYIIIIIHTL